MEEYGETHAGGHDGPGGFERTRHCGRSAGSAETLYVELTILCRSRRLVRLVRLVRLPNRSLVVS